MFTEALMTPFGFSVAAGLGIFGQHQPCSNWKMESEFDSPVHPKLGQSLFCNTAYHNIH